MCSALAQTMLNFVAIAALRPAGSTHQGHTTNVCSDRLAGKQVPHGCRKHMHGLIPTNIASVCNHASISGRLQAASETVSCMIT